MGIIKRGYSLQFAQRPPHFSGVVPTSVQSKDAHILRSEVRNLMAKGAVEMVPPAQSESGFNSHYFLVPKKDGGLRPILDLRRLNRALMKQSFRMTILNQILSQIRPGDWFTKAQGTFTKCLDAALSPLRQMGIHILNYLDDWLVLAQSEAELPSHRVLLLSHLE